MNRRSFLRGSWLAALPGVPQTSPSTPWWTGWRSASTHQVLQHGFWWAPMPSGMIFAVSCYGNYGTYPMDGAVYVASPSAAWPAIYPYTPDAEKAHAQEQARRLFLELFPLFQAEKKYHWHYYDAVVTHTEE